jgi:hypothetical protein
MCVFWNDTFPRKIGRAFIILAVLVGPVFPAEGKNEFFPVSVWYAGGKARAPMLEKVTPESPRLWKKDLEQIKSLGFNTVRTWIEWTNCEPEEDRYDFSAPRTVVDLAEPVRREFKRWAQPLAASKVRIELSVLGENAGLYGAAKLAWDRIGRS